MTSEDDSSLSEEELDEIASRVAEQLGGAAGGDDEADTDEIEVHVEDDEDFEDDEDASGDEAASHEEAAEHAADEHHRTAEEKREEARRRKREAKRRAREAREATSGLEDLGDRIEDAVEDQLEHLGEHLEHSLEHGLADSPEPPAPGVVIGPDDAREKAVYKTQLQKGGRVAVPDTETEALDLEPGDTLQVVLYPLD
jgi:hypothetical protein